MIVSDNDQEGSCRAVQEEIVRCRNLILQVSIRFLN